MDEIEPVGNSNRKKDNERNRDRDGDEERLWEWCECKMDLCAFMVYDSSTKIV